jgi:uncharacterized membrane protein
MKKIYFAAIILSLFSCKSNETTTEDTKNSNQVGVPNVNGNIPDTTNAINLSTQKKDTTAKSKDSMR